MDFFNRGNDDSDTQNGRYFVTKNGMPWALNIPYPWRHPKEYIDVKYAYPNFHDHIESAGTRSLDWFVEEQGNFGNIFTD